MLPKAILFDLDDTLISAYNRPDIAWNAIAHEFADELLPCEPAVVAVAINLAADVFWADAERHRIGRLQLIDARATIIAEAFAALARDGHKPPGSDVSRRMAARYNAFREEQMHLFDDAHHVVDTFRTKGVRLALITNGAAAPQRAKVVRFDLTTGFTTSRSKANTASASPRSGLIVMPSRRWVSMPADTWMVGDNLEWEVVAPQRLASTPSGMTSWAKACPRTRRSARTG